MNRKHGLFDSVWDFLSALFLGVLGWVAIVFVYKAFTL